MLDKFISLNPITQTIIASTIACFMTILGSSIIYLFNNVSKKVMNILLSISAGIMLSSSIFSLLIESINEFNNNVLLVSLIIIITIIMLIIADLLTSKKTNNNLLLLVTSIILHNIPEGMAIGVAFASINNPVISAISLSIGIGIQNIPEGSAVSIPLLKSGVSKKTSFLIGVLSAIVEPISAIIGAILVTKIYNLLPIMLSIAAGAMLYVTISDLIPECINKDNRNSMSLIIIISFLIMMILEIGL